MVTSIKDETFEDTFPYKPNYKEIRDNLKLLKDKNKILIWGLKDFIFPPKIIEVWKKIYPDIEVHEIENAGHFLQEDAPEEIIGIIKEFLKRT
ncbi:MAG: alpha/beta fold hydrolase [Candidatus Helarchaeota archaeon]